MVDYPHAEIQHAVLDWYKRYGRHDLPWRNLDKLGIDLGYGVMVSEFMLQQTQVERVILKYRAFLQYFPTVQALAKATPALVITLWSGLGYNRRATMLHQAAQTIVKTYKGIVPDDPHLLEALPGIGPYTAAAIAAFAFNKPAVVSDTNIERFYELLFWGYTKPPPKEKTAWLAQFIPENHSREWHAALMDLMSQIRTYKTPRLQQEALLDSLQLRPTWSLPKLTDTPLKRPKQSPFHKSRRYYRGQIVAYLRHQSAHRATLKQLSEHLHSLALPSDYSLLEILHSLKKDGLLIFQEPLSSRSTVRLPR